ncbi:hypothetical protein KJ636_04825 [Patescibacteria group bacterium]|nr:hypothetical protein [Patescibacteria group bacterium]MBU4480800.1 hypothetical protein [Patescibacteria group bacterium]
MEKIFRKKRIYPEEEIIEIARKNNMITVNSVKIYVYLISISNLALF